MAQAASVVLGHFESNPCGIWVLVPVDGVLCEPVRFFEVILTYFDDFLTETRGTLVRNSIFEASERPKHSIFQARFLGFWRTPNIGSFPGPLPLLELGVTSTGDFAYS